MAGVYARAKNIIKNGGATRGRYAGTRFLRIMRFTAACKYTLGGAVSNGQNCDFEGTGATREFTY